MRIRIIILFENPLTRRIVTTTYKGTGTFWTNQELKNHWSVRRIENEDYNLLKNTRVVQKKVGKKFFLLSEHYSFNSQISVYLTWVAFFYNFLLFFLNRCLRASRVYNYRLLEFYFIENPNRVPESDSTIHKFSPISMTSVKEVHLMELSFRRSWWPFNVIETVSFRIAFIEMIDRFSGSSACLSLWTRYSYFGEGFLNYERWEYHFEFV